MLNGGPYIDIYDHKGNIFISGVQEMYQIFKNFKQAKEKHDRNKYRLIKILTLFVFGLDQTPGSGFSLGVRVFYIHMRIYHLLWPLVLNI